MLIAQSSLHGTISQRLQCLLGLFIFMALAFAISRVRRSRSPIPWRTVFWGVALQFIFALIVLRTPRFLEVINATIEALLGFTRDGARMVFGNLIDNAVPVVSTTQPTTRIGVAQTGSLFAFFVL